MDRASGLRVPAPLGDRLILRALRESGGGAVAVTDEELACGSRHRHRPEEGIDFSPEGGAALAAARLLRAAGTARPGGPRGGLQHRGRLALPRPRAICPRPERRGRYFTVMTASAASPSSIPPAGHQRRHAAGRTGRCRRSAPSGSRQLPARLGLPQVSRSRSRRSPAAASPAPRSPCGCRTAAAEAPSDRSTSPRITTRHQARHRPPRQPPRVRARRVTVICRSCSPSSSGRHSALGAANGGPGLPAAVRGGRPVHGVPAEAVALHEVGAVDAIIDIVGGIEGFERLGIDRVYTRPVALGNGWVQHGPRRHGRAGPGHHTAAGRYRDRARRAGGG